MGEVMRHQGDTPRYGLCYAPSEYVETDISSPFGNWAEDLVMVNYVRKTGGAPGLTDFLDEQKILPKTGKRPNAVEISKKLYDFLRQHNPPMNAKGNLWNDEFNAKRTRVPDLLTHKPDRKDYYEIKPGSPSGVRAGNSKLTALGLMMPKFQLSYVAGTHYSPGKPDDVDITARMPRIMNVMAARLGLRKIKVTFTFRRSGAPAGLVLYWICIDMETEDEIEEEVVENIGRWYVQHIVREMKRSTPVQDSLPEPEVNLPLPMVSRYIPQGLTLLQMLMRAPPAPVYALLGGPELRKLILHEQMERQKALLRVQMGNVTTGTLAFRDRTLLILGSIPTVAATIVLIMVAGGGLAAAPAGAAAGAAPAAAVPAIVTLGAAEAAGAVVLPFAARAAAAPAVKAMSMAAGVICVLAFGNGTASAATPNFTFSEAIRAVPLSEVTNRGVGILGDAVLRNGSTGVLLGAITLKAMDDLFMALTPQRPPG